jgi:peptidylprolyl isomerase
MKTAVLNAMLVIVSIFLVLGCSSEPQVKDGDTVKVHYKGTLEDGSVFDSSEGREPLQFVVGSGQMIAGFDKGVVGMMVGEKKTITLSPEEAYGYPNEQNVMEVDKSNFPPDMELEEGMQLMGPGGRPVTVKAISDSAVTIDANHPLAGKTLTFEIELMEISSGEAAEPEAASEGEGEGGN